MWEDCGDEGSRKKKKGLKQQQSNKCQVLNGGLKVLVLNINSISWFSLSAPSIHLSKNIKVLTIYDILSGLCFLWNKGSTPDHFMSIFQVNSRVYSYVTWQSADHHLLLLIRYRGVKLWKNITNLANKCHYVNSLKRRLKGNMTADLYCLHVFIQTLLCCYHFGLFKFFLA